LVGEPEENRPSGDVGLVGTRWQMGGYELDPPGSEYTQVAVFMRKVMKLWDP
jgi:hypothetical protein